MTGESGSRRGSSSDGGANASNCALATADEAKCWGHSIYGEYGNGATSDENTPTLITTY